jgi:hypothetical protein
MVANGELLGADGDSLVFSHESYERSALGSNRPVTAQVTLPSAAGTGEEIPMKIRTSIKAGPNCPSGCTSKPERQSERGQENSMKIRTSIKAGPSACNGSCRSKL